MNRALGALIAMTVALVLLLFFSIGVGPGKIGPLEAWALVYGRLVADAGVIPTPLEVVAFDLRLPRTLLSVLLGAALGGAGAVTQGLFRNALAEPSVLGVSMGAAVAAVIGFSFGIDETALWATPLLASFGAVVTLIFLFLLAGGARNIVTVLLSGIALSSLAGAGITLMLAVQIERWELGLKVIGWLMGSFEGRSWPHLSWALLPCAIGFFLALWLRRDLDLLHLGGDTAASLGMNLSRSRVLAIACVGLLVGTATALVGVIGFVGLVVPHVARMTIGPSHRHLLPMSMLLGGTALLAVDSLSRAVTAIALPPGVITSLIGAPFFLWLLRRHDRQRLG